MELGVVLVNSRFPHAKIFADSYPQFWHVPSKMLVNPLLGRKKFKEYRFEGRHIKSLSRAPTGLGPTLITRIHQPSPVTSSLT
jgi:hypothetical protein